jgi:hypothetical protein
MLENSGKQCYKLTNLANVEETAITDIERCNHHQSVHKIMPQAGYTHQGPETLENYQRCFGSYKYPGPLKADGWIKCGDSEEGDSQMESHSWPKTDR